MPKLTKTRLKLKQEPCMNNTEKANAELRRVKEFQCHSEAKPKNLDPSLLLRMTILEKPMRSFILASKNVEKSLEKAGKICLENKIDSFDITIESFEKPIGIEDVRKLQKNLFFKPLRAEFKALVINAFRGITIESQNALLKILEEPPASCFIFLIVENVNILLPTIVSRCKIIKLEDEKNPAEINIEDIVNLIKNLSSENAGIKLKLAQDFGKSREEAIESLEKAIIGMREILLNKINSSADPAGRNSKDLIKLINKLEEGRLAVKTTNVNQRFILENTFLSI